MSQEKNEDFKGAPRRVNNSCSTLGTRRVNIVQVQFINDFGSERELCSYLVNKDKHLFRDLICIV
jgi:hypothetical protein